MSEPTYRIAVSRSGSSLVRWRATVRDSGGVLLEVKVGLTRGSVIRQARRWIKGNLVSKTECLYATETGQIISAPEPQSLRVAP